MGSYDRVGQNLGDLLTRWGLNKMDESAARKRRQEELADERAYRREMADLERGFRREQMRFESGIRPPETRVGREKDEAGNEVEVIEEWKPDFESGAGSWVRRGTRAPVMQNTERRSKEAEQYGLTGQARTAYILTGKLPASFGAPARGEGGARRAPTHRTAQLPGTDDIGYWNPETKDFERDKDGNPLVARVPRGERQKSGRDAKEDKSSRAPVRQTQEDRVAESRRKFAESNAKQFPRAPAVGTVEDGMTYMGGDPSNPNNWKR